MHLVTDGNRLTAFTVWLTSQSGWLGLRVDSHKVHSSNELGKLSQWLAMLATPSMLLWYYYYLLVLLSLLFVIVHDLCCVFSISGTVAVIVTCPLEVVKTRFQSSVYTSLMRTVSYTPHCICPSSTVTGTGYLAYELYGKTSCTLHSFLHKSPSGGFSRILWFIGWVVVHYCFFLVLGTAADGICWGFLIWLLMIKDFYGKFFNNYQWLINSKRNSWIDSDMMFKFYWSS